ncbi:hypothetical protein [Rhodococcus sp. MEB064]|uniref:hypothetical protein n=1 Tax=Rhodococcus sp. MEB064 TaxID=1587522 RepID=UPI0005AC39DA|nr:hypothetical protein [Rhodococcus sp. MEB064]KIQ15341.1 hypothetical protein RU01_15545 [Rhodococcus sp. MEB064]
MSALARLRAYEPVRLYVYPLLLVLVGLLVTRGAIDSSVGDLIIAATAAILGIGAAETARAKVTPEAKVLDLGITVATDAVEAFRKGEPVSVPAILAAAREAGTYFGNRGEHRKAD